jgi:hypothetical protein
MLYRMEREPVIESDRKARKEWLCCICGVDKKQDFGDGNHPWPIKEVGRCCNQCNDEFVVPVRNLISQLGEVLEPLIPWSLRRGKGFGNPIASVLGGRIKKVCQNSAGNIQAHKWNGHQNKEQRLSENRDWKLRG